MATFRGRDGEWKTLDNGVHIFIADGQSLDDAIKNLKPKEYYQYWRKNPIDKWGGQSFTGISRKEYENLLSEGKDVEARRYGESDSWYNKIPEDMEYRVWDALEKINEVKGPGDFRRQLRSELFGNGVNVSNYNIIVDAFRDEIKEKYNKLIEPRIKELNSIDIDNSDDYFMKNMNKQNVSQKFKETMINRFDECKDENLKSIAAANSELGLKFLENQKVDKYGNKIGTCYMPMDNSINIRENDDDLDTTFHEMFHGVFEKYNVLHSGLNETLKEEFNKKKIKEIKKYFGPEEYAKRNNINYNELKTNYEVADKELNEARDSMNEIYNNELNKVGDKSFTGYQKLHEILKTHNEYQNAEKRYKNAQYSFTSIKWEMERLESRAKNELSYRYPNFADMVSGATNNGFGYGHSRSYWKEDETNQVNEFFAEMSAIKATGSNEIEIIKKWLPNTVAKYEEVIKNISENKGKALELDL